MISFRDKEDVASGLVAVISILVILAGLAFRAFVKPPTSQAIDSATNSQRVKLLTEAKSSNLTAAKNQPVIEKLTWTGDPTSIGTAAMNAADEFATKRGLKMTVFRPQNAALVDDLVALPYVVTVEGSYLSTLLFELDLEDTKNKLAVTQIQISSSDPKTDKVTANIGIIAYVNPNQDIQIDTSSSTLQSRLGRPKNEPNALDESKVKINA